VSALSFGINPLFPNGKTTMHEWYANNRGVCLLLAHCHIDSYVNSTTAKAVTAQHVNHHQGYTFNCGYQKTLEKSPKFLMIVSL